MSGPFDSGSDDKTTGACKPTLPQTLAPWSPPDRFRPEVAWAGPQTREGRLGREARDPRRTAFMPTIDLIEMAEVIEDHF